MEIDYLLTATPSARQSLDLDARVDPDDIRDCLRIALQAANGSNAQSWRWRVSSDPALRTEIARLYRQAYLLAMNGGTLSLAITTPEVNPHSAPKKIAASTPSGSGRPQ